MQQALIEALEAQQVAEQQSAHNRQRMNMVEDMLRDLVACCEAHVAHVHARAARVPAHQWDQLDAIKEATGALENRIADIKRLL